MIYIPNGYFGLDVHDFFGKKMETANQMGHNIGEQLFL